MNCDVVLLWMRTSQSQLLIGMDIDEGSPIDAQRLWAMQLTGMIVDDRRTLVMKTWMLHWTCLQRIPDDVEVDVVGVLEVVAVWIAVVLGDVGRHR